MTEKIGANPETQRQAGWSKYSHQKLRQYESNENKEQA